MTDIELVVKIDADVYTRLFDNGIQDNEIATDDICKMARALRLGKPYEERKIGKWLFDISGYDAIEAMFALPRCSICGAETPHPKARYCPNCGAKMEVDE